jgi:hypothetical protein
MIPASYFFKEALSYRWEQPELLVTSSIEAEQHAGALPVWVRRCRALLDGLSGSKNGRRGKAAQAYECHTEGC